MSLVVTFEIHTNDMSLLNDLLEAEYHPKQQIETKITNGLRLRNNPKLLKKNVPLLPHHTFKLLFDTLSPAMVLTAAEYLFKKLKREKGSSMLFFGKEEIEIDQDEIERILKKKLKID